MMTSRDRVCAAIVELLEWPAPEAAAFVADWSPADVDDAVDHLDYSRDQAVGVAAVALAVRLRAAGGDARRIAAAHREAARYYGVICRRDIPPASAAEFAPREAWGRSPDVYVDPRPPAEIERHRRLGDMGSKR
jgi:hypothetical protein